MSEAVKNSKTLTNVTEPQPSEAVKNSKTLTNLTEPRRSRSGLQLRRPLRDRRGSVDCERPLTFHSSSDSGRDFSERTPLPYGHGSVTDVCVLEFFPSFSGIGFPDRATAPLRSRLG